MSGGVAGVALAAAGRTGASRRSRAIRFAGKRRSAGRCGVRRQAGDVSRSARSAAASASRDTTTMRSRSPCEGRCAPRHRRMRTRQKRRSASRWRKPRTPCRLLGHVEAQPGCDWETITRRRTRPPYHVAFDFDVRVPRSTRLRLCTVNGGDVHVAVRRATSTSTTSTARITLSGISGSGRAATVNGSVSAVFAENPKSASQFKSVNGDLDVILQPKAWRPTC